MLNEEKKLPWGTAVHLLGLPPICPVLGRTDNLPRGRLGMIIGFYCDHGPNHDKYVVKVYTSKTNDNEYAMITVNNSQLEVFR